MAQSTPTSNFNTQDFFSTTLSSAITSSDTTIPLVAAPTPTEGFLVIEPDSSTNREIIMYTSVSGASVVCGSTDDRGIGGTTARPHSSGVTVKMNTVSDMFKALKSGAGMGASFTPPTASTPSTVLTNPYKFHAYQSSNQTVGTASTTVTCNTEQFDTGSNYNNSTYIFTCPIAGFYYFYCSARIGNQSTASGFTANITQNSTTYAIETKGVNGSLNPSIGGGILLQCSASDTVKFQIGSSGASVSTLAGQGNTYFGGYLLSAT